MGICESTNNQKNTEQTTTQVATPINEVTTDDGMKFDNILIKNGSDYSEKIIKSLSDHFMVINEIEL